MFVLALKRKIQNKKKKKNKTNTNNLKKPKTQNQQNTKNHQTKLKPNQTEQISQQSRRYCVSSEIASVASRQPSSPLHWHHTVDMCYYCKALVLLKRILYSGVKYFFKTSLSYRIKQSRILGIPAATWLVCHRQQVGFSGMEPVRGWGQVTPAISHLPHSWPRRWGMLGDRRLQGKLSISSCPWWWSLGQNSRPHTLRGLSSSSHVGAKTRATSFQERYSKTLLGDGFPNKDLANKLREVLFIHSIFQAQLKSQWSLMAHTHSVPYSEAHGTTTLDIYTVTVHSL